VWHGVTPDNLKYVLDPNKNYATTVFETLNIVIENFSLKAMHAAFKYLLTLKEA